MSNISLYYIKDSNIHLSYIVELLLFVSEMILYNISISKEYEIYDDNAVDELLSK